MRAALLTIAALGVLPWTTAAARECESTLGRGWPPAVGNYGTAVTTLLDGGTKPALSLLTLPTRGVESAVSLVPGKEGADWTLRHSRADERVYSWVSQTDRGSVQFRTEQTPETVEIPIPAALAKRLVSNWTNTLTQLAPNGRTAPVSEGEVLVPGRWRALQRRSPQLRRRRVAAETGRAADRSQRRQGKEARQALDPNRIVAG